ncbi:hypothetical protein [Streptomyces sp. NPDC056647]|uniref:hypothetical protein n=1 Tax=unclassified Streptomyces TaxID=2593676 RepID=UPI0036A78FEB
MAADSTTAVRTAYLEGRPIAALARDHGVSRGAIRTGGLVAGAIVGTSSTDIAPAASDQRGTAEQIGLAGGEDTCQPVDRVTPTLIREGWDSPREDRLA